MSKSVEVVPEQNAPDTIRPRLAVVAGVPNPGEVARSPDGWPAPIPSPGAPVGVRLALSTAERIAVVPMHVGQEAEVVAHVADRATALAGPDGAGVRRRSLARALALAETQMNQLAAYLSGAVVHNDGGTMRTLARVLELATERYRRLLEEHRVELAGGRRSVLVVGNAENVHVTSGGAP